jgi:hypothetical protein
MRLSSHLDQASAHGRTARSRSGGSWGRNTAPSPDMRLFYQSDPCTHTGPPLRSSRIRASDYLAVPVPLLSASERGSEPFGPARADNTA